MELGEDGEVAPTLAGRIASTYYLQVATISVFAEALGPDMDLQASSTHHHNRDLTLVNSIQSCSSTCWWLAAPCAAWNYRCGAPCDAACLMRLVQ